MWAEKTERGGSTEERESERKRRRACKKHLPEEFTAKPRGVLWLRVQVELHGFLGYLSSTYPVVRLVKGRKRQRQPERKSLVENAFPTKLPSKPTGSASNMQTPPKPPTGKCQCHSTPLCTCQAHKGPLPPTVSGQGPWSHLMQPAPQQREIN